MSQSSSHKKLHEKTPQMPSPAKLTHKPSSSKPGFSTRITTIMPLMGTNVLQDRFFNAVYTRNLPEVKRCLEKGVDPNMHSREFGVTPLHLIAERNDFALGHRLMQYQRLNVEAKTAHGYTALHLVATYNCKEFALMLLDDGANPDARGRAGKTPLHLAVECEHVEIVRNLLKKKATVNVMDCFQNTPLSNSILRVKNLKIAKILMAHGADMRLENKRDLHLLFETVLGCHCIEDIDFVVLLLDHGVDVNTRDELSGRICLHFVAVTGYMEVAIVLITRGAEFSATDKRGRTPAVAAAEHGNRMLADYFRKGYRPPHILRALPFLYLWAKKVKARIAEQSAAEAQERAEKVKDAK